MTDTAVATTFDWDPTAAAGLLAAGMRPRDLRTVLAAFGSYDAYVDADDDALAALGVDRCTPVAVDLAGRWAVVLGSADYPAALAASPTPPPVLFGVGDPGALVAGVAVVGTRRMTAMGDAAVTATVDGAARVGATVVSGLALGVDAAAHRAALAAGLVTVAVIATDPACPTPSANVTLASEILAAGGAVVAEQLPGVTTPTGPNLQARNRIIAGLATVVVPCEATLRSGTMGTVRAALGADRALVVPRPKASAAGRTGTEALWALTDPRGTDPAALGVRGALADKVARLAPVANAVAEGRDALTGLVALAHRTSVWFRPAR